MPIGFNDKGQIEVIIGTGDICGIHAVAVQEPGNMPSLCQSFFGFIENAELVASMPNSPQEYESEADPEPQHEPRMIFRFASETALHGLIHGLEIFRDSYYNKKLATLHQPQIAEA